MNAVKEQVQKVDLSAVGEVAEQVARGKNCAMVCRQGTDNIMVALALAQRFLFKGRVVIICQSQVRAEAFIAAITAAGESFKPAGLLTGKTLKKERERLLADPKVLVTTPVMFEDAELTSVALIIFDEGFGEEKKIVDVSLARHCRDHGVPAIFLVNLLSLSEPLAEVEKTFSIDFWSAAEESYPEIRGNGLAQPKFGQIEVEPLAIFAELLWQTHRELVALDMSLPKLGVFSRGLIKNLRFFSFSDLTLIEKKFEKSPLRYQVFPLLSKYRHLLYLFLVSQNESHDLALVYAETRMNPASVKNLSETTRRLWQHRNFQRALSCLRSLRESGQWHWQEIALLTAIKALPKHKRTVIFSNYVNQAERLRDLLTAQGFKVACLTGKPTANSLERRLLWRNFASGEFSILVTTSVFKNAPECPPIDYLLYYSMPNAGGILPSHLAPRRIEYFYTLDSPAEGRYRQELRLQSENVSALTARRQRQADEAVGNLVEINSFAHAQTVKGGAKQLAFPFLNNEPPN